MALPSYAITSDTELITAVRDLTSYDDTQDELPGDANTGQMSGLVDQAKRDMAIKTGSDEWYDDLGYGNALVAHLAIIAKAAVENINLVSYSIGNERVELSNADPEDSQQIQTWAQQVANGLDNAEVAFENDQDLSLRNTASYVG
jgi:hypothetical protein